MLLGGGATTGVRGVTSRILVSFTAPGARPTLIYLGNAPVLTITGTDNLHGFDIVFDPAAGPDAAWLEYSGSAYFAFTDIGFLTP
jgi:hypothetical protein